MTTRKILIADDDADIIIAMKAVLESAGHSVIAAKDEKECLDKYKESTPDVVFLDLMMENMNSGIKLCKEIRAKDKNVKIYLLSAVGEETAGTVDIHEIGFNGAMSKPVSSDVLLDLAK